MFRVFIAVCTYAVFCDCTINPIGHITTHLWVHYCQNDVFKRYGIWSELWPRFFLKLIDNKYQWMDCIRHDQTVNKALDGRDTGNLYLRWIFFFLHRTVDLHSVCNSSPRVSHWFIGDINSNYNEINTTASAMLHLIYYTALSDFFHT